MTEAKEKNCDILSGYLHSILYGTETQNLDIMELDEPYRKLGCELQFLNHMIWEALTYSESLSRGNLSTTPPPKDNFLCKSLKGMQDNLNHMTWQAKQIANGDYSQKMPYLGELSRVFNGMTARLKEREARLKQEILQAKNEGHIWKREANIDPLTGIGNRNLFKSVVELLLQSETAFAVCYCDLDHLKYVNDHLGHAEGDHYIRDFVKLVKEHIRDDDVFTRIGGDEFCIILHNCKGNVAHHKLSVIQRKFAEGYSGEYDRNFSYGIVCLPKGEHSLTAEELLQQADQAMYEQKNQHRLGM